MTRTFGDCELEVLDYRIGEQTFTRLADLPLAACAVCGPNSQPDGPADSNLLDPVIAQIYERPLDCLTFGTQYAGLGPDRDLDIERGDRSS